MANPKSRSRQSDGDNEGAGLGLLASDERLEQEGKERGTPNKGNWRKIRHVNFEHFSEEPDPIRSDQKRLTRHVSPQGAVVEITRDVDRERGDRHHAFFTDAELAVESAQADAIPVEDKTDQQLIDWISDEKPSAEATIAAAKRDPSLAQRILDAEAAATGGEPREDVLRALAHVIQDAD